MLSNPEISLRRSAWLLAIAVILSVGNYLLISGLYYRVGFPLDDSWIHQTFARNLAEHWEWAFLPGQPSGGSTAPLWSMILAVGYWLHLAPFVWTYALGAVILWALAFLIEFALRKMVNEYRPRFPFAGLIIAFEWHLIWAADSGMETILYTLLVTIVLILIIIGSRKYLRLGLLIGLSVWVRPEGITLLVPAIMMIVFSETSLTRCLRSLTNLAIGFCGLFIPYLLFNLALTGFPMPSTFYAKQAEYSDYLKVPILMRIGNELHPPLTGVGIILFPGTACILFSAFRRRAFGILTATVWLICHLVLYAWLLPVTYQHGRYVIPVIPVFFLFGMAGIVGFSPSRKLHIQWILSISWRLTATSVLVAFWIIGAIQYAQDVAIIESEMVTTARWVENNLPSQALVAAHDIGALGYYSSHNLVDLAGLISPEVVLIMRDESQIKNYLDDRGVNYLVTFPNWYPSLTRDLIQIFNTGAPFAPSIGEQNMAVFIWSRP